MGQTDILLIMLKRVLSEMNHIWIGFSRPMLILSPFSRGGFVSSDLFADTSVLRFLETRFGGEGPNLAPGARAAVGDLTSALDFRKPDESIPNLPSTLQAPQQEIQEVPTTQTVPIQEPGNPTRPSGVC